MRNWAYQVAIAIYGRFRPNTKGVKGIVVDDHDRVLLVRHTYVNGWHLPGGGVKRRENSFDALERELLEETGVEVKGDPRLLGRYGDRISGRNDVLAVYIVSEWSQSIHANLEIAEAHFYPVAALPKGTTSATRQRIAEWRGERPVSRSWR